MPLICWALLFAMLGLLHTALLPYADDDAYIHLRIARNWAENGAPYFNAGEAVNTDTAPAWLVLVTSLTFLGGSLTPFVLGVVEALLLVSGALVWRRVTGQKNLAFAAAYIGCLLPASTSLMETPLALLLLGAALARLQSGRSSWFAYGTLACFVRPECSLFLLIYAIVAWYRFGSRFVVISVFYGVPVGGLFFAMQLYYYGTAIPHSVTVKGAVYQLSFSESAASLSSSFLGAYRNHPSVIAGVALLILTLLVLLLRVSPGDADRWRRHLHERMLWPGALFAVFVAGAYVLARGLIFTWYSPLIVAPFTLLLLPPPGALPGFKTVLFVPGLWGFAIYWLAAIVSPVFHPFFENGARVRQYLAIGTELRPRLGGTSLLTSEIGALGYASEAYIIDAVGLATPSALRYHPLDVPRERSRGSIGAIPPLLVRDTRPAIIVSLDIFAEAFRASEEKDAYTEEVRPPLLLSDREISGKTEIWGSPALRIYTRRELP